MGRPLDSGVGKGNAQKVESEDEGPLQKSLILRQHNASPPRCRDFYAAGLRSDDPAAQEMIIASRGVYTDL